MKKESHGHYCAEQYDDFYHADEVDAEIARLKAKYERLREKAQAVVEASGYPYATSEFWHAIDALRSEVEDERG